MSPVNRNFSWWIYFKINLRCNAKTASVFFSLASHSPPIGRSLCSIPLFHIEFIFFFLSQFSVDLFFIIFFIASRDACALNCRLKFFRSLHCRKVVFHLIIVYKCFLRMIILSGPWYSKTIEFGIGISAINPTDINVYE